jgi:DNA-binding PadR family transcriptional regulator
MHSTARAKLPLKNTEFRRNIDMDVKILCLGALDQGDATGYEIKKMFQDGLFAHFLEASFGSIYPALTKLTEEGLLTCKSQQQDGRPDKKIYSITAAGRTALTEAIQLPVANDKFKSEFLFVMLFADVLAPETVTALIENRMHYLQDELAQIQSEKDMSVTAGHEFVRRYGEAVMDASLKFINENRHLVESPTTSQKLEPVR